MEHPPLLLEETAVGHLLGQGVRERVDQLGEQTRLIQELDVLEMRQAAVQCLLGYVRNGPQQGEGYVRANHGRYLEQAFLLRW
jgi:hypothetical protein